MGKIVRFKFSLRKYQLFIGVRISTLKNFYMRLYTHFVQNIRDHAISFGKSVV